MQLRLYMSACVRLRVCVCVYVCVCVWGVCAGERVCVYTVQSSISTVSGTVVQFNLRHCLGGRCPCLLLPFYRALASRSLHRLPFFAVRLATWSFIFRRQACFTVATWSFIFRPQFCFQLYIFFHCSPSGWPLGRYRVLHFSSQAELAELIRACSDPGFRLLLKITCIDAIWQVVL